jgi:hypothetical protein
VPIAVLLRCKLIAIARQKAAFGSYGRYSLLRKGWSREEMSALDRFLLMQNLWGESHKID